MAGMKLDWPLILEYRQGIQAIVCYSIYEPQDREDMEQDVMMRLVEKGYEYDPSKCKRFKAWLWTKVRQSILDILRHQNHSRSPKAAKKWATVNRPWPLIKSEGIEAPKRDNELELVDSCLGRMNNNVRAYAVLRFRGITRDVAATASGIRSCERREFSKLISAGRQTDTV